MSKPKIEARKLKGFLDFKPDTMIIREAVVGKVKEVAAFWGFQHMDTPAIEFAEVLLGEGGETDKQVYQWEDNGGRQIGLRFDLTVPFARFIGEHGGALTYPFRRLQIGKVWRAEKPQKGRYREFSQCDMDIIGVDSKLADLEILTAFAKVLSELKFGKFAFRIGHRKILNRLCQHFLQGKLEQENEILIILDKLDKIGSQKVCEQLASLPGLQEDNCNQLLKFLADVQTNEQPLDLIKEKLSADSDLIQECDRLGDTIQGLSEQLQTFDGASAKLDISIARGLGYYTGIVFETILPDQQEYGSICSGGRYNQLAQRFSKQEQAGIGGSLGLDRFVAALEAQSWTPEIPKKPLIFIAIAEEQAWSYAFEICQKLRTNGYYAELNIKPGKLSNQFKYANKQGFPHVVTVGSAEMANKTINLKNMKTGDERKGIPLDVLVGEGQQITGI